MNTPWPKNPDGTPKRMGQLTREQQRAQFIEAIERLKPELKRIGISLKFGVDDRLTR